MSQIILPDRVRHKIEFENQLENLNERHDWLRHFDAELRRIDPYLSLVKASEVASKPGLTPGFWHVQRDNPETMPTYIPLTDPDGGFAEPSGYHLEMIRKADLQRPGSFEAFKRRQEERLRGFEREREAKAQERRVELAERIAYMENPSVSMSSGWTNSVKGRRAK